MTYKTLGFIGGGRITRILLEGLERGHTLPARVVVSDPNKKEFVALRLIFPPFLFPQVETVVNANELAAAQDIVFLAVHPPIIAEVAESIRSSLRPEAILVSLAPKFTIARLSQLLGGFQRIVRVIPNAPSLVNAGFNPVAFSPALSEADQHEVNKLLAVWGDCPRVAEEKLEAYAVLTAMGPTYFWFQLYELRKLAQEFGLTLEEASIGLESMLLGALKTMNTPDIGPEEVEDLVPIKPLKEMEPHVTELYRSRLAIILQKIKP